MLRALTSMDLLVEGGDESIAQCITKSPGLSSEQYMGHQLCCVPLRFKQIDFSLRETIFLKVNWKPNYPINESAKGNRVTEFLALFGKLVIKV